MTSKLDLPDRARSMRNAPTEPEKRPWRHLSNSQPGSVKFRRQSVIEPYIVDFLCPAKAFVVEIAGDTHIAEDDRVRDVAPLRKGYRIIRVTNSGVMTNVEGVLAAILAGVSSAIDRRPQLRPSPEGAGLDRRT